MGVALFSLDEKVALVTGGNGGLGWAIAVALRDAGARVAVAGRNAEKNRAAAREFGENAVLELDVRDERAVQTAVESVVRRSGRLDILVNCAGLFRGGSILVLGAQAWHDVLDSHLTGTFLCAKHAARAMIGGGRGGKIINIGSMYSLFGPPDFVDYSAAKAGVLGLTRGLAVELAKHEIQVNAILPGWFETDLTRGLPDTDLGQEIRSRTPAGRWGVESDLAGALAGILGGRRFSNDAELAAYAGVEPLEASSAGLTRHRLNRGGNRKLNSLLYFIALTPRITFRRPGPISIDGAEGKTRREARRALTRFIVRAIWRLWQECRSAEDERPKPQAA